MKKILCLILFCCNAMASEIPGVAAKSFIVTDIEGNVIIEKNATISRPIASITKLLVAEQISNELNTLEEVIIQQDDLLKRKSRLPINSKLSEEELLRLSLISSVNQAVYALVRVHDTDKIVNAVNNAAKDRGLFTIHIDEPTGLSPNNKASAKDLAKFVALIYDTNFAKISVEKSTENYLGHFNSTNPLIGKPGWNFTVSKTGFINASGGCLVTLVEIDNKPLVVVILGSTNVFTRWTDLIKIRTYLAKNDLFWKSLQDKRHVHNSKRIKKSTRTHKKHK